MRTLGGFFKDGIVPEGAKPKIIEYAYEISKIKEYISELKAESAKLKAGLHESFNAKQENTNFLLVEAEKKHKAAHLLQTEANQLKAIVEKELDNVRKVGFDLEQAKKAFNDEFKSKTNALVSKEKVLEQRDAELYKREVAIRESEILRVQKHNELMKKQDQLAQIEAIHDDTDKKQIMKEVELDKKASELAAKEKNIANQYDDVIKVKALQDKMASEILAIESSLEDKKKDLQIRKDELTQEILIHKSNTNDFKVRSQNLKENEIRLQQEKDKVEDMRRAILKGEGK